MGHDAEHGAVAQHAASAQFQLGGIRMTHTAVETDRTSLSWPCSLLRNLHHSPESGCRFRTSSFSFFFALSGCACTVFSFSFLFLLFTLSDTPLAMPLHFAAATSLSFVLLFGDVQFLNWRDGTFFLLATIVQSTLHSFLWSSSFENYEDCRKGDIPRGWFLRETVRFGSAPGAQQPGGCKDALGVSWELVLCKFVVSMYV